MRRSTIGLAAQRLRPDVVSVLCDFDAPNQDDVLGFLDTGHVLTCRQLPSQRGKLDSYRDAFEAI